MEETVQVKSLEINSLDELILEDNAVLIEVIQTSKSGLILDSGPTTSLAGTSMIKWEVTMIGDGVKKYQLGDSIVDLKNDKALSFYESLERQFILTDSYNIKIAVRKSVEA